MQWLREGPKFKQASVFFFAGALGGVGAGAAEEGLRLQGPGDPIRQKSVACRLQEVFRHHPTRKGAKQGTSTESSFRHKRGSKEMGAPSRLTGKYIIEQSCCRNAFPRGPGWKTVCCEWTCVGAVTSAWSDPSLIQATGVIKCPVCGSVPC